MGYLTEYNSRHSTAAKGGVILHEIVGAGQNLINELLCRSLYLIILRFSYFS